MKKLKSIALITGLATSGAAFAADGESSWKGEAELGLVSTTGNTETQTVSGKAKIKNTRAEWTHKASLEALSAETEDTKTAERYNLTGKSQYKMSERAYAFGRLAYEDDRFSGYEYQGSATLGAGYSVLTKDTLTLDLEAGPGVRQSKLDDADDSESESLFYIAGDLMWKISDTSTFTEELTSEIGEDVTISKSVTGLKTQINGDLAMKITYTIKNTSEVPAGVEKNDTETAVTLVYSF